MISFSPRSSPFWIDEDWLSHCACAMGAKGSVEALTEAAKDAGLGPCTAWVRALSPPAPLPQEGAPSPNGTSVPSSSPSGKSPKVEICQGCQAKVQEYAQGARAEILCRLCLRREDEALLAPADQEQGGLDRLATVLDTVSWKYWKPGEQPAQILEWMFLGDLKEATDFDLLQRQNIRAVLNLINWWELSSRLPEVSDFTSLYSSHDVEFLEVDSEDRLFFDIVEKCWPLCEGFLRRCKASGQRVLVNCKAGHNRSACMCVCWLMVHEGMTLMDAVEAIQCRRGTILSNHGFRLQLVRLALRYNRLGDVEFAQKWTGQVGRMPRSLFKPSSGTRLDSIIHQKRMTVQYDIKPDQENTASSIRTSLQTMRPRKLSLISEEVHNELNQRALKMELLACLYHRGKKFLEDYEYTSHPPTVIGSGFSGDVFLCRRKERAAVRQNKETYERCVKMFDLSRMSPEKLDKLKNEAVIYLSLEHPNIARLFDVYEDEEQVSLVMQFCSGGTLENAIRTQGAFSEPQFQEIAVPMLMAINYIHRAGIVHRDIKPRNWVYEADGKTIKLIDFGFSVKGFLGNEGSLQGCMGTLGYLAPEVVLAGLSSDNAYTDKCDIWSLGVVFVELLTGEPAFHRDAGQCDGYTEEVVLREIKEVTEESVAKILDPLPGDVATLLRRMLTREPVTRPSAAECLEDPYLAQARDRLKDPPRAMPVRTILDRFHAHSVASRAARAWLLAVARSPTYLPWEDFMAMRDTFKMFDAHGLSGTVKFDQFLEVIERKSQDSPTRSYWASSLKQVSGEDDRFMVSAVACQHDSIRRVWRAVCGEQDSLSYCEFLAVLLPPIEDVFEDAGEKVQPEDLSPLNPKQQWIPSKPISEYIVRLKRTSTNFWATQIFNEHTKVRDAVLEMARNHMRWCLVKYEDGSHKFFDYFDINHKLLETAHTADQAARTLELLCEASIGTLANCSRICAFVPASVDTPAREVLKIMAGRKLPSPSSADSSRQGKARRVPLMDAEGNIVGVFSAPDFLHLALRYTAPSAVLKSLSAKVFDRRSTILQVSVQQDEPLLHALQNMKAAGLSICPTTSRELSGDLGGVVASNVVSVADLKWIIRSGRFDALGMSVCEFLSWRTEAEAQSLDQILRLQRLHRFNVVSVHEGASLHTLALRLLASKLSRLFLASDEIARIVGIVSSRDIILQVLDQIVPDPSKSNEQPPSQKYRRKLEEVAPCASSLYEAVERPTLLSQTMEDQLRHCAPYLTAKQVEHVLRSSQLEPSLRHRLKFLLGLKRRVEKVAEGYGGPAFMPQGMAVGFFLATAIRASFAGTDERNKAGGSRILQGKAAATTLSAWLASVLREQKAVATELCRLQERQKSLAEQALQLAGLSNAGAQVATGNVSMPNRPEERPFDAGEVPSSMLTCLAADGLPPSHSAAIGANAARFAQSQAAATSSTPTNLPSLSRSSDGSQKIFDLGTSLLGPMEVAILLQSGLAAVPQGRQVSWLGSGTSMSSFLVFWLLMFFDAWREFQCLACCTNVDSVITKDEVPAEKLVPVATVFSRPVDVTLADPCVEEVLQSRPMVCRRPRVQQASGDEEDVPVEVVGDDWPQQPPERSFGSSSPRLPFEDVQRIVVTDLKNFKGHIRSPDQRDMFALIMARFANAEVQEKLSPLLGRVSMMKGQALRETGVTATPPKGMLPIIATWRSLKTEYYYFYFELGDRSDIEFPQEPLAIEHWRCGRLLRIATAFLCNDTLSQVPAAFGRLTDEEQAGADDFEDGDGLVIPVVSRDEASFGGLTLEKTLRRYQDACEAEQPNGPRTARIKSALASAFSAGGVAEADAGGGATKAQVAGDATYEGGWLNGQKHGQGSLTLKALLDSDSGIGDSWRLHHECMHQDGSKYVGQFKNDKKDGSGVYHYPSGAKYTGQWVNDLQEGDGKEEWADGSVFEGQFKAGAKHGRGKFVWSTLCRYEGEFDATSDNNDMHGEGVYTWNDGRGYSGQWNRNTMAPRGKMWWSDGRTYEGEFLDGRKHGEGTLKWPDGRSYSGQWQDGKQHGTAIARTAKGLRRQSNWKDCRMASSCRGWAASLTTMGRRLRQTRNTLPRLKVSQPPLFLKGVLYELSNNGPQIGRVDKSSVPSMEVAGQDEEAFETPEERMAWLRARGVRIEEPGQSSGPAPSGQGRSFAFVRIPVEDAQTCEELDGPHCKGDALPTLLGPRFAGCSLSDEVGAMFRLKSDDAVVQALASDQPVLPDEAAVLLGVARRVASQPAAIVDVALPLNSSEPLMMGISFESPDGQALLITDVSDGAASRNLCNSHNLSAWMRKDAQSVLKQHDRVLSVEGHHGDAEALQSLIAQRVAAKGAATLKMKVVRPQKFLVHISDTGKLGMELKYKDLPDLSTGAIISEIDDDGLVAKWNSHHPEAGVAAGDFIVAVNDVSLPGPELLKALATKVNIKMTVLHYSSCV
eukprot:s767_g4.t2